MRKQSNLVKRLTNALLHAERMLQRIILEQRIEHKETITSFVDIFSATDEEENEVKISEISNLQNQIRSFNERLIDSKKGTNKMLERVNIVEADNRKLKENYYRIRVSQKVNVSLS